MKIVVPFAEPAPYLKDVTRALVPFVFNLELVKMTTEESYFHLLQLYWKKPFIVIEQDVVPTVPALHELINCPNSWCGQPYPYLDQEMYYGLGCMKFGAELVEKTPDVWEQVGVMRSEGHPPKHWCAMDGRLQSVLRGRGWNICQHGSVLEHRGHAGHSSHGCR